MELFSRTRWEDLRADLICISVVPRTYHRPVFDCFQYIESRSNQEWTVGRPGNKDNLQRMHYKLSSRCLGFPLLVLNSTSNSDF